MKILLISLKGGSGSDVYFKLLKRSLDEYTDIESTLIFIPNYFEKLFFLIPAYLKYKKIRFDDYELIHTPAEFGVWFRQKNKILSVVALHYALDKELKKHMSMAQKIFYSFWVKPNLRRTLLAADKIVSISQYTKDSILCNLKTGKNIQVIYPGVDTDFFKPLVPSEEESKRKTRVLFVGNLTKRKGVDLLPGIMERLGDDYELRFTSGLRTKIPKELKRENMVPLRKISDEELVSEYNKCDLFISPSRLEGFGYSVAEAMACGKPVAVTDYSSFREIVKNGIHGYLCRINDIDDFAYKIAKIKERLDNHENFLNNQAYVKDRFSLRIMAHRYRDYFRNIN